MKVSCQLCEHIVQENWLKSARNANIAAFHFRLVNSELLRPVAWKRRKARNAVWWNWMPCVALAQ
jgi:hypothetical protein